MFNIEMEIVMKAMILVFLVRLSPVREISRSILNKIAKDIIGTTRNDSQ